MGYDVSLELRDTDQREAYDEMAKRLHVQHAIDTWGNEEPSDWQIRTLWSGGSAMRDLAEFLSQKGNKVEEEDGDEYCPSYVITVDKLIMLGNIYNGLMTEKSINVDMVIVEHLGLISTEEAFDYWHDIERGSISKTHVYIPFPVIRSINLPALHGTIVKDDESAPVPHDNKKAWEAYLDHIMTENDVINAKNKLKAGDITYDEYEVLCDKHQEAERHLADVRPHQDTFSINGMKMDVSTYDHDISFEIEHIDSLRGAQFKALVASVISNMTEDVYDVHDIYELIADDPGTMLMTFQRLGEIGKTAQQANIEELVLNPSW